MMFGLQYRLLFTNTESQIWHRALTVYYVYIVESIRTSAKGILKPPIEPWRPVHYRANRHWSGFAGGVKMEDTRRLLPVVKFDNKEFFVDIDIQLNLLASELSVG